MPSEISDLLDQARAGGPPLRHDVEFVLVAGRRRRRRRTAGLAIVAVVAVAAAIGVPQIVARRPSQPAKPTPTPTPVVITTPASGELFPFLFHFHGYDAGAYRVGEPSDAGIRGTTVPVTRIVNPTPETDATLAVYGPGVDPLRQYPNGKIIEAEPVHGRRAFWLELHPDSPTPSKFDYLLPRNFYWEYADGLLASVGFVEDERFSAADARRVAEGFTLSEEQEVTVPLKIGYVPPGWKLSSASGKPGKPGTADGGLNFVPEEYAAAQMSGSDGRVPDSVRKNGVQSMMVLLMPSSQHMATLPSPEVGGADPAKVHCDVEGCYHPVDNGRFRLRVGGSSLSNAEARKMLASITLADPDDPSTWFPAHATVPEAVQIRVP
ncbi:hypothetical protein ACQPZX_01255 [Actinoplanes sp. CA-142083]|uniref:hypothetical protein n=1 Tax=Actinoplanes sp. CA-142083 TaxID=3239903 RepID=UPI003D8F1EEA